MEAFFSSLIFMFYKPPKKLEKNQVNKTFQKNPKLERKNNDSNDSKVFNRYKDIPKLPLMKVDRLDDVWYVDSAKLEEKVIGNDGIMGRRRVNQWMNR
ncbi:hypothetical protein FRX31_030163 [Thalictrum thalictroides]|uniref:Uncharacterized protein n=1 Tax=Thalictrum thalictroides TaxID=46969 RepID=A0A7J6V6E2_THATH|nr:hypothetical protein FRX31_030163 [Thalictrum thalictroides]